MMEQTVLTEKNMSEIHNVKGMAQKNVAEKVSHQKLQRQIDKQKKAFVKQHSKDENELKLILQRLQLEQQLHDGDVDDLSDEEEIDESSSETSEDEGIANPYPIMIMPKFGVTSLKQDKNKNQATKFPARFTRRKSLEYEDVDKIKKATSGVRTTLLAASFISKLRSPFSKRTNDNNDPDENWCEQWETTASIRRPRKTVAEQNQHKLLQRAKSEQLSRPGSSHALSAASVYADRRIGASSRYGNKKDDAIHVNDLQYEGTVEDGGSLSPRGIPKSRRGGSLKERKVASNEDDAAKMRRCNSTKERRKKNPLSLKDSNGAEIVDENKTLSRKNSKDYKTSKSKSSEGGQSYSLKTSRDSLNKESGSLETINLKEPLSQKSSTEDSKLKTRFKEKHLRQGSLKERGEEKSLKLGGRNRLRGLQSAVSTKKTTKRQMSLSTDSSPLSSPKSSPTSKEKHFDF